MAYESVVCNLCMRFHFVGSFVELNITGVCIQRTPAPLKPGSNLNLKIVLEKERLLILNLKISNVVLLIYQLDRVFCMT